MLRIDQIPLDSYIATITALGVTIAAADAHAEAGEAKGYDTAASWRRVAREAREAKALLESHRFPKLAELAGAAP